MLNDDAVKELEKQQYRIVGKNRHSAVKVCGWTKNMIRGKGGCYKFKFYGINSAQCMQMSPSMSCANRCVFCWRGYKAPVSKEWPCGVDDPTEIIEESLAAHEQLLYGFGGHKTANKKIYELSKTPRHVALSLTGEPITYPRINEALDVFHKKNVSTFMVTNAQYPDQIQALEPVTQLYLSVDAPTKEMLKEVDKPLFSDYWERLNRSLDILREKTIRTTIRLTMIKEVNMSDEKEYADLIKKGDPDFVEIKSYMFVGASRQKLSLKNMPYHEEVVEFTKKILPFLADEYDIADEHKPSRVVLLAKKKFFNKEKNVWQTWIDFDRFFELWEKFKKDKTPILADEYSVRFTKGNQADGDVAAEDSPDEVTLD